MDFVADALFDGRKLRMLTVVDHYALECLAIGVGQSLRGEDVVQVLNSITEQRGLPQLIKSDNGGEFISKVMDKWAYDRNVKLDFSGPGKPSDNANFESFNGRLRQECLNETWFMSLDDARVKIEVWRTYCNESRPHSALDWATPAEFARLCRELPETTILKEPEISTSERSEVGYSVTSLPLRKVMAQRTSWRFGFRYYFRRACTDSASCSPEFRSAIGFRSIRD